MRDEKEFWVEIRRCISYLGEKNYANFCAVVSWSEEEINQN